MTSEQAEILALQAAAWLIGHDSLQPVFLGATGASPEDLRNRLTDHVFLASVLEFLTQDDAWVTEFCDAVGRAYDQPMRALAVLSGEARRHWT